MTVTVTDIDVFCCLSVERSKQSEINGFVCSFKIFVGNSSMTAFVDFVIEDVDENVRVVEAADDTYEFCFPRIKFAGIAIEDVRS